jgi:hypothetical protein
VGIFTHTFIGVHQRSKGNWYSFFIPYKTEYLNWRLAFLAVISVRLFGVVAETNTSGKDSHPLPVASFPIDDLLFIQFELLATLLNQPKVNNDAAYCMVNLNYFCLVMLSRHHGPSNICLYMSF